jgi:hypothetical protein
VRVERVELSTGQFLKLPPLPLGYTRALVACGRWDSNPQPEGSIFKTDAFAVYATSAQHSILEVGLEPTMRTLLSTTSASRVCLFRHSSLIL